MTGNPERVFLFRLARELHMTVSRLMREADSREIAEWMAFFSFEADEEKKRQGKDAGSIGSKLMAATKSYNVTSANRKR